MGPKKGNTILKAMATPRSTGRSRVKGNINPDTQIEGNSRFTITTDTAGVSSGLFRLDMLPTGPVATVGGLYQQYLFKPGTAFNYVPSVGLNTAGNIVVGWIDNPEMISNYLLGTTATRNAITTSLANIKVYPIWQAFSYPLTAAPRRKRFDVNVNVTTSENEMDRSTQGLFVWSVLGAPASTTVSMSYTHSKVQLWNLVNSYST